MAQAATGDGRPASLQHRPDVVVMDIRMPGGSGIDACRASAARRHSGVMLRAMRTPTLFDAIDAGASGYVQADPGRGAGGRGTHGASGGSLLDPAVTRPSSSAFAMPANSRRPARSSTSQAGRRVLAHRRRGLNRQIADRMGWPKTVRNYVSNILAKLALESQSQAAACAIRNHLWLAAGEHERLRAGLLIGQRAPACQLCFEPRHQAFRNAEPTAVPSIPDVDRVPGRPRRQPRPKP